MRNTKVYSILEHFDKYEQNRLRKYLQSPYFNKNDTLVELFEIFIRHINSGSEHDWSKEKVWKKLIPKVSYDDVRFRKYLSDLLKLVEGFLAQQAFEQNPLHQAAYLIGAVGDKKINKLYRSTMRSARRLSSQQPHKPASYYYHQYQIENNFYKLTEFETKRDNRSNVEEIAKNLDFFYLAEKLKLCCTVLSQQNLVSYEYKLLFIDEIITHIKKYNYDDVPPIALYYQIYLIYKNPEDENNYYKLKSLLDKYALEFPLDEAKDELYMAAQNYCIRKINQGSQTFLNELFILYKTLLERNIIVADGTLSPWYFRNIIVVSLRLGEYGWTETFIQKYQSYLPESFRINAVTYNLAQLYFYQKAYDKVIEQLRNVEYEDVSYNLNSKTMLLATYYEMDEIEPLYSLMDSFRAYLNRRKDISEQKRSDYTNLIKFIKKIIKIAPNDKKTLEKLKKEIISTKNIASKGWLREKITELEN